VSTRFFRRSALRILAAGAALVAIGCSDSPTSPSVTRSVQPNRSARHDDIPTDPCRSGWNMENGKWVCHDI